METGTIIFGKDTAVYCGDPLLSPPIEAPFLLVPGEGLVQSEFVVDWVEILENDCAKMIVRRL